LQTRNRIALILLDSTFEIALKEFIVHRTDLFPVREYSEKRLRELFQNRNDVIDAVRVKVDISDALITRAKHYYGMRNTLIHERATVDVPEADIRNYRRVLDQLLIILFGLNLSAS
jgi:hypothetical protein